MSQQDERPYTPCPVSPSWVKASYTLSPGSIACLHMRLSLWGGSTLTVAKAAKALADLWRSNSARVGTH